MLILYKKRYIIFICGKIRIINFVERMKNMAYDYDIYKQLEAICGQFQEACWQFQEKLQLLLESIGGGNIKSDESTPNRIPKMENDVETIDEKIEEFLKSMGFIEGNAGFSFIKQAVKIQHELGEGCKITKEIYPRITPDNPIRAERSIRYAIQNAYETDNENWKTVFGEQVEVSLGNKKIIYLIEKIIWK